MRETNNHDRKEGVSKVTYLSHFRQRQTMLNLAETLQTPFERKVLLYLRNTHRPSSLADIRHRCCLPEQDVRSVLSILVNKGLVRRVESGMFVSP